MNDIRRGRWAQAKCNGDFIAVETYSGYRSGSNADPKGQQIFLSSDTSDDALGNAVLSALASSRFVIAAPRDDVWIHPDAEFDMDLYDFKKSAERYATWLKTLLDRHNYKTKRDLLKDMKTCFITEVAGVVTIGPSRHEKLETWVRTKDDDLEDVVIPAASTPAEIGMALRLAFSRCKG